MQPWMIVTVIAVLAAWFLLNSTLFTVKQQSADVIQRFGKFVRVARPGLNVKIPLIEHDRRSASICACSSSTCKVETKTEDNVFVHLTVAVQYFVKPEKVYEAFYKLDDSDLQITSFVFDVVRARVPAHEARRRVREEGRDRRRRQE